MRGHTEADYKARVERILAALELRVPDRVPICLGPAGAGRGYILGFGAGPDDRLEENLRVMIDTAKQYGRYS